MYATKFVKDGFTYYKVVGLGSEIAGLVNVLVNPPEEYHSVDDINVEEENYE